MRELTGPLARTIRRASAAAAVAGLAAAVLAGTAPGASASVSPAAIRAAQAVAARAAGLNPAISDTSDFLAVNGLAIKAGGRTWTVSTDIDTNGAGVPGSLIFQITTSYRGGQEAHDWSFGNVPDSVLAVTSSGSASTSTGKALGAYGNLSLSFKPTSHTTATCSGGGKDVTYLGKVTGSVKFATGLHKLTLSKSGATFTGPSLLSVETNFCSGPSPCEFASWEAASNSTLNLPFSLAAGVVTGTPGHQKYFAELLRTVELNKAQQITRSDGAIMAVKAPAFNAGRKELSVTTSKSGAVTGSMVIGPAKQEASITSACTIGTTKYKETDVSYGGKYASPKGGQITTHTVLTPSVSLGRTGTAGFDIITKLVKQ
jgi:hypothetical protein